MRGEFSATRKIGRFLLKPDTQDCVRAPLRPCGFRKTGQALAGSLAPRLVGSPLHVHLLRANRRTAPRFLASVHGTTARRRRYANFSPVAGSVCNLPSQRALHSAGRTHLSPQNAEIIPPSPAPRQLPAPARTGTRCRTRGAKTQIPHRVCKHGAESPITDVHLLGANVRREVIPRRVCKHGA